MMPDEVAVLIKNQKRKYILYIGILLIVNTVGFMFLIHDGRTAMDRFEVGLNAGLVGCNILGFVVGALIALIPYKGLSYIDKYVRSSLLTILIIQITWFIMEVLLIPLIIMGYY